jgi:hypothetical protein
MLDVLAGCEWLTGTGAVPSDTFREIVTKAIGAEEIKSLLVFVEQMDLGDRLLPGIKDGISAEAGVDALLVERGKGVPVFLNLMNAFIRKKEEIIQKTWEVWFVEDFLKKYTFSEPRNQAREILFTLQRRLRARREAVERFEYHRLETIDENCKQLLTTLEQYGIKATTYDQALREFERRYGGPKEPPKSLVEKTHQDVEERIGDLVRLQEARDTALRANPEWGEFIRWEYQKAIDQLSERRR